MATGNPVAASVRLDVKNEQAWQGTQLLRLTPKAFGVLRYLLEHPEQLVSKDDLLRAVWPDVVVSEWALTTCIREIRKELGERAQAPRYIETVHRRGYRFIGPLTTTPSPVSSPTFQVPSLQSPIPNRWSGGRAGTIAQVVRKGVGRRTANRLCHWRAGHW